MKKTIVAMAVVALTLTACKKADVNQTEVNTVDTVKVPVDTVDVPSDTLMLDTLRVK